MMKIKIKKINQFKIASANIKTMGTVFTAQVVFTGEVTDEILSATQTKIQELNSWLKYVDNTFSTYKSNSDVSKYRDKKISVLEMNDDMKFVYASTIQANIATQGKFNADIEGKWDPSGFVKGWSIEIGEQKLEKLFELDSIQAVNLIGGGDMQFATKKDSNWEFKIGVISPFDKQKIVQKLKIKNGAIATSGITERGQHIKNADKKLIQTTVIGNFLQEVDVWATALMVDANLKLPKNLNGIIIDKKGGIADAQIA